MIRTSLLDGEPRTADAVALEETDLLALDRSQLMPVRTAGVFGCCTTRAISPEVK
ncbi:hypothetical protein [Azospirillum humicireducens]|uniref:hypothetical protein n=1 Tax=Azospirillum humicireducens TaxID=1226968 RepID=UPI001304D79A|nr:hypothetical protein [Azospirillum humicireducens]